jgi:VanZ family protein
VNQAALYPLRWPRFWLGLWIALWGLAIVLCLLPLPPSPFDVQHFDKIEHVAGYAALAAFAAALFASRRALLGAALGLILLGLLIEGLQSLVPWRSADVMDLIANAVGVALGSMLTWTPLSRCLLWFERLLPS